MRKDFKKLSLELMTKVIFQSAVKDANSTCFFIGYQPKLPEEVKKLRKF